MDVTVLNSDFERIAVIDSMQSIIWTDRYQEAGNFEIYTQVTAELLYVFQIDYYLQIQHSDRTMIIESIEIKTNVETGNKLIVKGRSLESILDRRIVFHQTQFDDYPQEAIRTLIACAFTNPEDPNGDVSVDDPWHRKVPNMVWVHNPDWALQADTDQIIKAQYYTDNVYDVVKSICRETDIGFKIILTPLNNTYSPSPDRFSMSVYKGQDRSYGQNINPWVTFSPEFDNLINSDYFRTTSNLKTYGVALSFIYDTGALHLNSVNDGTDNWMDPKGLAHREVFLDLQYIPRYEQGTSVLLDTDIYNAQIKGIGRQILKEQYSAIETFEGKADSTIGPKYGVDFFLGDIVQIENEYGLTGTSRITEVTFSESPSGIFIYPTFTKL